MPVGPRVLIADADPEVRRQLHQRLLDQRIFSDLVSDGRAAMEMLKRQNYSVILLDLSMPNVGAEQILEHIGKIPLELRPVMLVVATGSGAHTLDVELVQIVLRKPWSIVEVADILQSCVQTVETHRDPASPSRQQTRIPIA